MTRATNYARNDTPFYSSGFGYGFRGGGGHIEEERERSPNRHRQ